MARRRSLVQLHAALATLRLASRALRMAALGRSPRRLRRLARLGLLPALMIALLGRPLLAAPAFPGPIFSVRVPNGPFGRGAAAAMDAAGNFVVTWTSLGQDGDSTANTNVYARRFAANGTARGATFLVNTTTIGSQGDPSVAMDADGDFVIAWTHPSTDPDSFGALDVFARRFPAVEGTPGEEFRVNETRANGQFDPAVSMADDGSFVVAWTSVGQDGDSTANTNVYARRFPSFGEPGPELLVNQRRALSQSQPALALDSDGDFIVAWTSNDPFGELDFDANIYARRFPARTGAPGEAFLVNSFLDNRQRDPAVAVDAAGNAVIAWSSRGQEGDSSSDTNVYARRFPVTETPGEEFRVNVVLAGPQIAPRVAMDTDGDFVIAWSDSNGDGPGDLFLRQFHIDGSADDEDRLVNDNDGAGSSSTFGLADNAEGEFVVAWDGVLARLYRRPAVEATETDESTAVSEGGATDTIAVALRNVPNAPVIVTLTPNLPQIALNSAAPGAPVQLRFEPELSALAPQTVTVRAAPDNAAEGDHGASIQLSVAGPASGYENPPASITVDGVISDTIDVAITDDRLDQVTYTVTGDVAATNEGNPSPVTFTVRRDGAVGGANDVTYRFAGTASFGEDYIVKSDPPGVVGQDGFVRFAEGETRRQVAITIVEDNISEPSSSIILELVDALPAGSGRVIFPVAVLTLSDNDLAEVQILQTGGGTRVVRGGPGDKFTVALRSVPTSPVQVKLKPANVQLELNDAGWGAELTLTFAADESALKPQTVRVTTAGSTDADAALAAEQSGILLSASSADKGYDAGTRFTVDGQNATLVTVTIEDSGKGTPRIMELFLPIIRK